MKKYSLPRGEEKSITPTGGGQADTFSEKAETQSTPRPYFMDRQRSVEKATEEGSET